MSFVIIQGILFFFKYEEIIRGKVFKWEKEETEHGWQTSNQHTYSLTLFFFPPSLSLFLSLFPSLPFLLQFQAILSSWA